MGSKPEKDLDNPCNLGERIIPASYKSENRLKPHIPKKMTWYDYHGNIPRIT
jgi:hypothetical protein